MTKKLKLIMMIAMLAMPILSATTAHGQESFEQIKCTFASGDCSTTAENDICWLTISNRTNGHAGACGEYGITLCCTRASAAGIKASCSSSEKAVLAISQVTKNAHSEEYFTFYNNYVCITPQENAVIDIQVSSRGSPPSGFICALGLSNKTNAHVGDCATDPYSLGVYVRTRDVVQENNTMQVKLNVRSTADTIYIPGVGEKSYTTVETKDYSSANPYFVSSTTKNQAYGIVASEGETVKKAISKTSNSYQMELHQDREDNTVIVVFTKTPLLQIQENMNDLLNDEEVESFGYEFSDEKNILIGLIYDKMIFRNSDVLLPGNYELKFEHLGTRDKKIVVKVTTVTRS